MDKRRFFCSKKEIFKFIKNDKDILEKKPLEKALKIGQLNAYKHRGFEMYGYY